VGVTRTGGGFSGRVVGPGGAVVGSPFAAFLNKVTTKTVVHSLIDLVMSDCSVMFRTASVPQQKLELDLATALRRVPTRS
jgi:hypothetical protein